MLKPAIALVLLAHGIGHSIGLLQLFKVAVISPGWDGQSWLLTPVAGDGVTHLVAAVLWTAALVGFVLLAAVVLGWLPVVWFNPLAVASAALSLAGIVLFPTAFPPFSMLGAAAVDLVVLAAVAWYHWLPTDLGA